MAGPPSPSIAAPAVVPTAVPAAAPPMVSLTAVAAPASAEPQQTSAAAPAAAESQPASTSMAAQMAPTSVLPTAVPAAVNPPAPSTTAPAAASSAATGPQPAASTAAAPTAAEILWSSTTLGYESHDDGDFQFGSQYDVPAEQNTFGRTVRVTRDYLGRVLKRLLHHARLLDHHMVCVQTIQQDLRPGLSSGSKPLLDLGSHYLHLVHRVAKAFIDPAQHMAARKPFNPLLTTMLEPKYLGPIRAFVSDLPENVWPWYVHEAVSRLALCAEHLANRKLKSQRTFFFRFLKMAREAAHFEFHNNPRRSGEIQLDTASLVAVLLKSLVIYVAETCRLINNAKQSTPFSAA